MPENDGQNTLVIHYNGQSLAAHTMCLDDFLYSLDGLNNLLQSISSELGIEKESLTVEISPIEEGGIKFRIIVRTIGLGIMLSVVENIGTHVMDDLSLYERCGAKAVVEYVNRLIDRKKSVSDYKNINKLTQGTSVVETRVLMNKQVHASLEQFTSIFSEGIDTVAIRDIEDNQTKTINYSEKQLFKNPFSEQDLEEKIYDEERILRLDGPRSLGSQWLFYEKNTKGEWDTKKIFKAEVLDDFLLDLGRRNSLENLQDKDLFCIIRYKETKKIGNKKRTILKYIIKCTLHQELPLTGEGI